METYIDRYVKFCIIKEFKKSLQRILSKVLSIKILRTCSIITKIVFSIRPYDPIWEEHFDLTTYTLKKALDKIAIKETSILEVGTGHIGILSIYLAKKGCKNITAVDINPDFVDNARKNAKANKVSIGFSTSDLFSNFTEKYDLIFFNPPYVPTEFAKRLGKTINGAITENVWHGGKDGTETISRFLREAHKYIEDDGQILLGVNNFYVSDNKIRELIENSNAYIYMIGDSLITTCSVYMLKKR